MLVDRVVRSNAVFLVSGFRFECLLPNKEENSEEAWEPAVPACNLVLSSFIISIDCRL